MTLISHRPNVLQLNAEQTVIRAGDGARWPSPSAHVTYLSVEGEVTNVCGACGGTHGGVQPSSFIHGQESVTGDAFDADDPLRDGKELQDTCMDKQHTAMTDG